MPAGGPKSHRERLERIARQAMIERGLAPDFPPGVAREVAALDGPVRADEGVKDLREWPWVSIDNDDSRDIDQLTAVEALSGGLTRVLVAVADVASLVAPTSATDGYAHHNTTSVYTVPRVFPMLPLELSTDLSSLNEDAERVALVSEARIDTRGMVVASDVYRARVRNQAKLAYPSVGAWLEGRGSAPGRLARAPHLAQQVRQQDEIAQAVRRRRLEDGALEFETRTPTAEYDDGHLKGLVERGRNRATELVENFMITANGVMAGFLGQHGALIVRVVRRPNNWPRLREVAAEHGQSLPPEPDGPALSRFLVARRLADPGTYAELSLVVIKLLGRGEYVVGGRGRATPGHFGLAVRDYAHSTAPNRRFVDLVLQRLALAVLDGQPAGYRPEALQSIAERCTEKENDAEKVERRVRKSAAALFLQDHLGQRFDAVVTGATDRGTWVRIQVPPVEGMLIHDLEDRGVGQHLRVELVEVDVERGHVDFQPA